MAGVIVSTPPAVELPPGSSSNNPSSLPPVTYQYAVLNIPQTWTALQTFPQGMLSASKVDVGLGSVDNTSDANKPVSTAQSAAIASAVGGSWINTRLAKTALYTVANADKGKTIALGGAAFYALTLGAASGYDANFAVMVLNEDTGRGKTIACNGLSNFILWPGQSVIIFNQNNVWKVFGQSRWKLTAGITLFVSPTGNDANDGLDIGSPVQTLFQVSVLMAQAQFDAYAASSPQVAIQLADGTYTGGLHLPGTLVGGAGNAQVSIRGNASTPANVIVQGDGAGAPPFAFFDYAVVELKNMKLQDTAASLLTCETGAICRLEGGIIFGQTGSGQAHMFVRDNGAIIADVGYTISAAAAANNGYHIFAIDRANVKIQSATVTFSASVTFNTTILAQRCANVNAGAVTWTLGAFTVTGKRFGADDLSMISVFGAGVNAVPGSIAGTTSNGGQCA